MKQFLYRVYGISFRSEIELPELSVDSGIHTDVEILIGEVPMHLPEISGSGVLYEATKNDFLFKFENIARYRVQNGNTITIQPSVSASQEEIRLFLLGSTMGALLHQRGMLAIHGSTISNGRFTTIIAGKSGVGKSSLAAGLYELGYSVLSDDISVVESLEEGGFFVHPGIPSIKLWKDVLIHLNQPLDLVKVRPQLEKYRIPFLINQEDQKVPLKKIAFLDLCNSQDFKHNEISGVDKFNIIRSNSYRMHYIDNLHQTTTHFSTATTLANSISLYRVERPHYPLRILEFARYFSEEILDR